MPYYPGAVIFRARASMLDVARVLVEKIESGFEFAFESTEVSFPEGFQDRHVAGALLQGQRGELSRFAIARMPHQFVFASHYSSSALELQAWEPNPSNADRIPEGVKAEWCALLLRIHQVLVEDAGALLSYTNAFDNHFLGPPSLDELAEFIDRKIQINGMDGLKYILENPFFWILALNRTAFKDGVEGGRMGIDEDFLIRKESSGLVVLESKKDLPLFLKF